MPITSCALIPSAAATTGVFEVELQNSDGTLGPAVSTYCDFDTAGMAYTLVGKVQGKHNMYSNWLLASHNVANLQTMAIEASTYSSIGDTRYLAVFGSSHIRFANSDASKHASWTLHPERTVDVMWNRAAGPSAITSSITGQTVTVTAYNGASSTCYHNKYGVMTSSGHGGSYPSAMANTGGGTSGGDWCLSIGVATGNDNGWSNNHNGFDAPDSDSSWPNSNYNRDPRVSVWLGTAYPSAA